MCLMHVKTNIFTILTFKMLNYIAKICNKCSDCNCNSKRKQSKLHPLHFTMFAVLMDTEVTSSVRQITQIQQHNGHFNQVKTCADLLTADSFIREKKPPRQRWFTPTVHSGRLSLSLSAGFTHDLLTEVSPHTRIQLIKTDTPYGSNNEFPCLFQIFRNRFS